MTWISPYRADIVGISLLALLMSSSTASAKRERPQISTEEARTLVYEALKAHNPHHVVDVSRVENPYDPVYVYFEATWPNPAGSPHLGNFAVNPYSGDVYNADGCEGITSTSLKRIQESIRRRSPLTSEQYRKARRKRPICGATAR